MREISRNMRIIEVGARYMNFIALDSRYCQILATCFNEVAEHFHTLIETGNVYLVSNGTVKKVVKSYNPLPRELESILNQTTIVELCDDNYPIPRETFKFFLISEIKSLEKDTIVDLIGAVTSISPTNFSVTKKCGSAFICQTFFAKVLH